MRTTQQGGAVDRPSTIRKTVADLRVPPNLADYAKECAAFSWQAARDELAGLPGGGLNIAHEAVERHAQGGRRDHVAFRFLGGAIPRDISFADFSRLTNRFANVLCELGVGKGDRLFVLTGRIPELYIAVLGSFKNGTVVSPLFSAFGPEPIATRVNLGEGAVLVTTTSLYRRKVAKIRAELPTLRHVLVVDDEDVAVDLLRRQHGARADQRARQRVGKLADGAERLGRIQRHLDRLDAGIEHGAADIERGARDAGARASRPGRWPPARATTWCRSRRWPWRRRSRRWPWPRRSSRWPCKTRSCPQP